MMGRCPGKEMISHRSPSAIHVQGTAQGLRCMKSPPRTKVAVLHALHASFATDQGVQFCALTAIAQDSCLAARAAGPEQVEDHECEHGSKCRPHDRFRRGKELGVCGGGGLREDHRSEDQGESRAEKKYARRLWDAVGEAANIRDRADLRRSKRAE
eukprot:CAMPEP_0115849816 /NCGR_PEP_ID=MMETSP0287-20121206/11645_1 /TAXON_ID=412157 /ORGANISM="Chrysochromulina rotalis, Strain UIO044" /LENGTH=155 /DNA_ID=CAMNT_0003303797 /DNA_START=204 /DNA_END=672 /DNA_ORIENTATION=+